MRSTSLDFESLSPWPEEFGLDRMQALLARLGDPQRALPGRSTSSARTASRRRRARSRRSCAREGLRVGAYTSPHVDGLAASGSGRRRARRTSSARSSACAPAAEAVGATQFEALTAAALAEFAARGVDVAVVEAGLGGRLDATNVLDAPGRRSSRTSRSSTPTCSATTREAIAREKLAVVRPGRDRRARRAGVGGARAATAPGRRGRRARGAPEALLGRAGRRRDVEVALPGRLERSRGDELWDGAHNPAGVEWLVAPAAERRDYVVVCSILARQGRDAMLQRAGRRSARRSSPRSRPTRARSRPTTWPRSPSRSSSASRRSPTRAAALDRARRSGAARAPVALPAR